MYSVFVRSQYYAQCVLVNKIFVFTKLSLALTRPKNFNYDKYLPFCDETKGQVSEI